MTDVYRYTDASETTTPADPAQPEPDRDRVDGAPERAADGVDLDERGPFVRAPSTVLSYAALGCYTFWLYAFGPAVALLRQELRFSYTVLGVYEVLWSAGAALAGAGFALTARHVRRAVLLWVSVLVTAMGAALFTFSSGVMATLLGAGVMGIAGTTMLTTIQAILSDRHGEWRDRALTEANVGAGASAVVAPLVLGALAASPVGWRATFAVPAIVLAALYLRFRRAPLPTPVERHASKQAGRLPLACWMFAALTAAGSAIEFCLVYFGTPMLTRTGLSTTVAATALSSNYLGILVGRAGGAALIRAAGRTVPLLYVSLAITVGGFVLFWLTGQPVLAMLGLFVCGVGIANLYPLSVALTLGASRGLEDRANARTQLLVGALAAGAPFALGALADQYGLMTAFAIEPVLVGGCLVLLLAGLVVQRRHRAA